MKRLRFLLWALVAAALIGFLTLHFSGGPQAPQIATASMPPLGGAFTLTGSDGQRFESSRLAGQPYAIFFGFTNCPDVCPTTLARLVNLRRQIGDDSLSIVFVSVDPERDTPATVNDYVKLFDAPIIGLTGSPAEVAQVKKQFGIFSQKVPNQKGGYSIDHSAAALLFDRQGKFQSTIAAEEGDSAALDKLKRLTGNS